VGSRILRALIVALLGVFCGSIAYAQPNMAPPGAELQPAAPMKPGAEKPIREIFVPFDDLQVILESDKNRVFLTREEYEVLLKTVQAKAAKQGPVNVVLLSAAYTGQIDDGRAQLTGKLEFEVINEGWHVIPLALGSVGVKNATLDGKPAAIARDARGQVRLFVNGQGKHQLELQLTAAVPAAAALQTLQVRLPTAASATLDLSVAGNVEVKGGASVVKRTYDEKANRTQLALLLDRGPMAIVMSLNNKQAREQRLVVARTVQVDEITLGYERLHVNVSHRILHDPVDRFRFVVPAGFEVTSVTSQRLSRWEVKPDDKGRQILEAVLSEATTEPTLISISANRSPELGQDWLASLQKWKLPRLQPLDVAGEVAVVGLLVENRLEPQELTTKQLLPIDSPILAQAMPESIFRAEPGAPIVNQIATYYVPAYIDATQYDLSANFVRPESGLVAATTLVLSLSDQGHDLLGIFTVAPVAEDLFQVRFKAPVGWRVQDVLGPDNQPLVIERYELADGSTRLLAMLRGKIKAGDKGTIKVRASSNPTGWLADWKEQSVTFPQLEIEGTTREVGAIAVKAGDDLAVQPTEVSGLIPLLSNDKEAEGLGVTAAAYRFESRPFAAKFNVERKQPSLAAEVFSFLQVLPDAIKAHYELAYQVREARTRQLVFSLPASTPKEITIGGLDGVVVKEFRSSEDGGRRRWTVQLAERQAGEIRLTVDFQQPLAEKELAALALPLAQAEDVEFQSAFASLEGSPELEVTPTTAHRTVDEAELYQARYLVDQPATADKRLIGAYGYSGRDGSIKVAVNRRKQHPLPSAIVQRAELLTQISANGLTQTAASYYLTTKATLLEVALPGDAKLWTMLVDGQPTKPQKEKNTLLVSLPPRENLPFRRLQIIYETTGLPLSLSADVNAFAPRLLLRGTGDEEAREVPQADVQWQLILPPGYALRTSSGTVSPVQKPRKPIAVLQLAGAVYEMGGGVGNRWHRNYADYTVGAVAMSKSELTLADDSKSMPNSDVGGSGEGKFNLPPQEGAKFDAPPANAAPAADPFGMPPLPKPTVPATAETPSPALAPPQMEAKPEEPNAPAPRTTDQQSAIQREKYAALEGFSSLPIEFNNRRTMPPETFSSFGVDPQLRVTLIDTTRIYYAALGVGLLVFLMGVALTRRPAKQQAAYVVVFLLLSALPVLLTSAFDDISLVFDYAFYAACALIPYYLVAAIGLSLWRAIVARLPANCCQIVDAPLTQITPTNTTVTPVVFLLALLLAADQVQAVEPKPEAAKIIELKDLLPLLEPGGPVTVPADAIIIPYDPEAEDGVAQAKKVLIPYAKFIELWNRAHPDKPKETKPAPVEFAVLAADYQATLAATDELVVTGKLTIDVLSDKPVAIPLPFSGGVLVKATLDGQPARLQVVAPQAPPAANAPGQQPQQQAMNAAPNAPDADGGGVIVLHTQGAGRKQAEISFRLGLTRRGGWRQVTASLPLGGSNKLTLTVPDAATEVRIAGTPDKDNFETKAANENIETTLVGAGSGRLDLQWRPKVAIGQIDQSLTSSSTGVLDVREDALRLTWVAQLNFGRGTRDQFEFSLPKDYAIEQVLSQNLRGWQVKPDAARQLVEVTLLKPATGSETITLVISKRGRIGTGEFAAFDAPAIFVSGAALQQGEIMIRRSPRLELRTETATGVSRADADNKIAAAMQTADSEDPSILNLRPYQSYRFVASGGGDKFALRLSAAETTLQTTAEVRSILRVADTSTSLNVGIKIVPQGQPVYRVEVLLPAGFELDELYPDKQVFGEDEPQWSVVPDAASGRNKLSVQLLDGAQQEFTLAFLGRLGKREKWEEIAAPLITVLNVERQQGEIVVAADPDIDVQATNLKNAETESLQQAHTWLKAEQQDDARVAVRYRVTDYGATFKLIRKAPRVTVRTLSNVKVTRRAIEETIVLDYSITQAGIREVQFLLPDSLRTARIRVAPEASLLQRKKIEPAMNAGQPVPGWLLVTLSLQDHVNDTLGVIVEHDRLLTDKPQDVSIPRSLTGTTTQRFVVIENVGRDEVVEVKRTGLEPIARQQQAFQDVVQLVADKSGGANIIHAFVGIGEQTPSLTFKTQANEQVQTAKARIEFARTTLVIDEAGGYRALVVFQINNSTEQYLDIVLPDGARLWTAMVKGQPVKPVEHSPAVAGKMRIPLVKSPAGSGDYSVEIKYGGKLPRLATLRTINFPLIRTETVNVEQSQVQLFLPDTYSWPHFGGTMSQVKNEEELEEGLQSYLQKKVNEAKLALQSDDLNTKLRAQANISGLMQTWQFNSATRAQNNLKQSGLALHNYSDLQSAQQEAQAQVQQQLKGYESNDNRRNINDAWSSKSVTRSKNVVTQLGNNFDQSVAERAPPAKAGKGQGELAYNPQFLKGNKLYTEESNEKVIQDELQKQGEQQKEAQPANKPDPAKPATAQPAAPQPQGRISRGGKQQQALQDLEGDRSGLVRDLQEFGAKSGQNDSLPGQPQGGGQPGGYRYPQIPGGQGRPGRGLGGGRGMGDQPEEELAQNNEQSRQRGNAFRYQQKLEQEQQQGQAQQLFNQQPRQSVSPFDNDGPGFSMGLTPAGPKANLDLRFSNQGFGANTPTSGGFSAANPGFAPPGAPGMGAGAMAPTGLASLDIEIPQRGQAFLFTMPRGDIEITATPASRDLLFRLTNLGIIAALIALGVIVYRICRQLPVRKATGTMAFAILLILLGLISVIGNILPVFGAVLLIVGIGLLVLRLIYKRNVTQPTA
jgi:hypothetical protein